MNYSHLLLSISAFLPGLVWTVFDARAQTCSQAPSCSELGYTKTVSQCAGKTVLKCPFNAAAVYCNDDTACAALGFTDNVSECPGNYVKCPADSSKGKCDFEASPGDLKYSLRTSDHNGWLLCNGRYYSSSQYPELYSAISGSFGSYLPNYSGYFLKAAATSSAYSLRNAEQAGLPNITGTVGPLDDGSFILRSPTGAFYNYSGYGYDAKSGSSGSGRILGFSASRSNSIYGRSTTVTPQNYSANVFIYTGRKK